MKTIKQTPTEMREDLIFLCTHEPMRSMLQAMPHPTGMKHQFTGTPLSYLDCAWSATMTIKNSVEWLPKVRKAISRQRWHDVNCKNCLIGANDFFDHHEIEQSEFPAGEWYCSDGCWTEYRKQELERSKSELDKNFPFKKGYASEPL